MRDPTAVVLKINTTYSRQRRGEEQGKVYAHCEAHDDAFTLLPCRRMSNEDWIFRCRSGPCCLDCNQQEEAAGELGIDVRAGEIQFTKPRLILHFGNT